MTTPANHDQTHDEAHRQLVRALTVERFRLYRQGQSSDDRRATRIPGDPPPRAPLGQSTVHDGTRQWVHPLKEELVTGASLRMTVTQAQQVPPVVDVPTAAAMLGIGRTAAYELIRLGRWPTPVLRLGKLIRIPSSPILELIQVER